MAKAMVLMSSLVWSFAQFAQACLHVLEVRFFISLAFRMSNLEMMFSFSQWLGDLGSTSVPRLDTNTVFLSASSSLASLLNQASISLWK